MEILKKVFSMRTMGVLILLFGIAIGVATFLENDFGTISAKAVVYNARWFEILIGLLIVNMIVSIFTYRLYKKEKIVTLIFHVAFIVVLMGAGITRYIGFEGIMHIREGESSNTFISENAYVSVWLHHSGGVIEDDEKVLFSELGQLIKEQVGFGFGGINYEKSFDIDGEEIEIELVDFMPHVEYGIEETPDGGGVITLVTAGENGRKNEYVTEDQPVNISGFIFTLNDSTVNGAIHIMESDSGMIVRSPLQGRFMRMADQSFGDFGSGEWTRLLPRQLYVIGSMNFVFNDFKENASLVIKPSGAVNSPLPNVATFMVRKGDVEKQVRVTGGRGINQDEETVSFGNVDVSIAYGAMLLKLPFRIALEDFQLERYPGSESPSSYASEVVLHDEGMNVNKPYRIYMNNILEHRGFRFYQSSYDQDEKGTVLSVNHDYWGTFVTYWGYFFLFAGLVAVFFSKNTRFAQLSSMINQIHRKRAKAAALFLGFTLLTFHASAHEPGELPAPEPAHAKEFGKLLVQTQDGRITPLNTVGNEILRKVVKKDSYKGLNSDQVFLGMISHPSAWREEKMIRVNHEELYPILGIDDKYASFVDFFTHEGVYKLQQQVEQAFAKKPAVRTKFDKEVIAVDERVNISYMAYFGSFLKLFPIPGHPDNKWTTPVEPLVGMSRPDSLYVSGVIPFYIERLEVGMQSGDYAEASEILGSVTKYQEKFGADVLPSQTKVTLEIFYNNFNLFKRLFPIYMLIGFGMLIMLYIRLLKPVWELKWGIKITEWLIFACFGVHALGLASRWYISGHEPWSNGYESMIYIAWAGLLAGIIFRKKSPVTMSVTAILAGIILFVAHLSWMDPEITNLVPVLKSYWLTIHVATITASYGFLALGALLAFVNLLSMIIRRTSNRIRLNLTIKEVTYVIEMTITVGLVLLTIGNFLGGIWANESWGRYWGWDPKETWAMASIIFYAFVLHMRFIPGLRGPYAFNLMSLVTFSSILMTYFGVNYYLAGLHSYAKGDPLPIPAFVKPTLLVIAAIAVLAFINDLKDRRKDKDSKKGTAPGNGLNREEKMESQTGNSKDTSNEG